MNEEQYFEKSRKNKFTLRCPIIDYCTRRAYTICFYSGFEKIDYKNNIVSVLQKESVLPSDFLGKQIKLKGEVPIWSKGKNTHNYYNMHPEVNLFDSENSLPFASGTVSVNGDWGIERLEKFKNLKNKHFSECLEYNVYIFENRKIAKSPIRKRSPISSTLRFEIFQKDNFKCQYCGHDKKDDIKLVLDHKTPYSDGGKDEFQNSITSCNECNQGKSNRII